MIDGSAPLVTIITVVRNSVATIARTLDSVRAQRQVNFEHVIIDGASSDGTLDVVKANYYDRLYLQSEADRGIYDAMNKGVARARGEWLLFLGADDVLTDSFVLSDIFKTQDLSAFDLVCGASSYVNGRKCVPRVDWHTRIFNTIHHQAAFYRRRLFDDFRYRLDIPVVADYELNFRIYRKQRPVLLIDRQVAISSNYGVSHFSNPIRAQIDSFRIRSRYETSVVNTFLLTAGLANIVAVWLMDKFNIPVNR